MGCGWLGEGLCGELKTTHSCSLELDSKVGVRTGLIMKFGKRLIEAIFPEWADNYIPYKALKQKVKGLHGALALTPPREGIPHFDWLEDAGTSDEKFEAEGTFMTGLMAALHKASSFFTTKVLFVCC